METTNALDMKSASQSCCLAGICAILLLAGCYKSVPPLETWPVSGSIVDQNGQRPVDGVVRLLTDTDAHLISVGPIQSDGTFTVHTQRQGYDYPGAPAGTYDVLVITSKPGDDGKPVPIRFEVPKSFTVAASDNTLNLEIHR